MYNKRICVFILILGMLLSGCMGRLLGTHINQPKEGEPGRYSKVANYPYEDSFDKVKESILELKAVIIYENKKEKVITAIKFDNYYKYCIDTTKLSVYFYEIDPSNTRIDIACHNYDLALDVSNKIYEYLGIE